MTGIMLLPALPAPAAGITFHVGPGGRGLFKVRTQQVTGLDLDCGSQFF